MDDDALFAELYPRLRRFAAAIAAVDIDPDDLVQEAVARTLRKGPLCDLDDAALYLRRAVLNLTRNQHRDTTRRANILERTRLAIDHTDVYPSDFTDLSGLTVDQRAVLFLRFVENQSTGDIARMLDLTENAVRARASRAIKTLRIDLEERSTADEER